MSIKSRVDKQHRIARDKRRADNRQKRYIHLLVATHPSMSGQRNYLGHQYRIGQPSIQASERPIRGPALAADASDPLAQFNWAPMDVYAVVRKPQRSMYEQHQGRREMARNRIRAGFATAP